MGAIKQAYSKWTKFRHASYPIMYSENAHDVL